MHTCRHRAKLQKAYKFTGDRVTLRWGTTKKTGPADSDRCCQINGDALRRGGWEARWRRGQDKRSSRQWGLPDDGDVPSPTRITSPQSCSVRPRRLDTRQLIIKLKANITNNNTAEMIMVISESLLVKLHTVHTILIWLDISRIAMKNRKLSSQIIMK